MTSLSQVACFRIIACMMLMQGKLGHKQVCVSFRLDTYVLTCSGSAAHSQDLLGFIPFDYPSLLVARDYRLRGQIR